MSEEERLDELLQIFIRQIEKCKERGDNYLDMLIESVELLEQVQATLPPNHAYHAPINVFANKIEAQIDIYCDEDDKDLKELEDLGET